MIVVIYNQLLIHSKRLKMTGEAAYLRRYSIFWNLFLNFADGFCKVGKLKSAYQAKKRWTQSIQ